MKLALLRRSTVLISVALLAASAGAPAFAQWKWRDKSGQIHISDLPPPREVADKDVLQRPTETARKRAPEPAPAASAASAPAQTTARVDPELEARRKRAEQELVDQRKQDEERNAATRAENCKRAQAQLRSLESGMRLARVNDKGEREVLDDKQRAEEMQRARSIVASDCR